VADNQIADNRMRLFHTREVIQDLDGIVLRDEPGGGTLSFDLVRVHTRGERETGGWAKSQHLSLTCVT
jgi:hypothetical protein